MMLKIYNTMLGKKDTKRCSTILEHKHTPFTAFHLIHKMYPHIQEKKTKSPVCEE